MLDALMLAVPFALWMPVELAVLNAWAKWIEECEEAERGRLMQPLGLSEHTTKSHLR